MRNSASHQNQDAYTPCKEKHHNLTLIFNDIMKIYKMFSVLKAQGDLTHEAIKIQILQ